MTQAEVHSCMHVCMCARGGLDRSFVYALGMLIDCPEELSVESELEWKQLC